MNAAFFCPPVVQVTGHEIAYSGLVKLHAMHVAECERWKRSGRLTHDQVHKVATDLSLLDRQHDLDETIERILAEADRLELEREAKADAEFRARARNAALDAAR